MGSQAVDTSYDRTRQTRSMLPLTRRLSTRLTSPRWARVADLACGTGLLSGLQLERQPSLTVCCIDLDPQGVREHT